MKLGTQMTNTFLNRPDACKQLSARSHKTAILNRIHFSLVSQLVNKMISKECNNGKKSPLHVFGKGCFIAPIEFFNELR